MRMSPINQPLMLMELLGHGFAGQQPARPSAEHRPADAGKRMVGRVLNGNGITRYGDRLYTLIRDMMCESRWSSAKREVAVGVKGLSGRWQGCGAVPH